MGFGIVNIVASVFFAQGAIDNHPQIAVRGIAVDNQGTVQQPINVRNDTETDRQSPRGVKSE